MAEAATESKEDPFTGFPVVEEAEKERDAAFDAFPPDDPSIADKVVAFGQGATGTAIETGSTVGGMLMGAGIGSLGGPFAPFTVPAGAAIGAGAGFIFGKEARKQASRIPLPSGTRTLTTPTVEDQRPDLRGFGFAGEVFGGGLPFAAAPLAAVRAGSRLPPSKVGNFINRIIDMAGRNPATFAAAETGGLAGSATAAAVSETFAPGETGKRIAAEVAGGFFNPSRLILGATKGTTDVVKAALETMSEPGRQTRAAKVLKDIVESAGEDPDVLAALLNDVGIGGLTSAQKTGSPALVALEAKLRQQSAKFGSGSAKSAESGLSIIKEMITLLRGTGDPQALSAAADIQKRYFRTLLASRVQTAEREAAEAVASLTNDTPDARAAISQRAQASLDEALKEARDVERGLWEAVPRDIPAEASNIVDAFARIRERLLPEEVIPDVVEGFVARVTKGSTEEAIKGVVENVLPSNSGELLRFRSRMLARAREAAGKGDMGDASIFGQMAEAALDDLTEVGARAGGVLDEARAFSRELHDTFTRTFSGTATARTGTGADRVAPELLLKNAFGTGREAGELRLREIEDATRFLSARGLDTPEAAANIDIMVDAQERILRLVAADTVDPNTGRASATRLGKFLRDNELLMNRFPEIRQDIQRAIKAENGLVDFGRLQTSATRVIDQKATFAKLAKFENPVDAVAAAVRGNNPVAELLGMVKVAKRGGPEAMEGLQASVWDYVLKKAGPEFSFEKLRAALDDPIRAGQPSLADLIQRSGIMSKKDLTQARKILDEADKITKALETGAAMDEFIGAPDALFDLVIRITGARLGAQGAVGAAAGSSLVAAGAGVRFMKGLFEKVPKARVQDVLIEAAKNPRFAALLLKTAPTQADKITLTRQIHAYMLQAGLFNSQEGDESIFDDLSIIPPAGASELENEDGDLPPGEPQGGPGDPGALEGSGADINFGGGGGSDPIQGQDTFLTDGIDTAEPGLLDPSAASDDEEGSFGETLGDIEETLNSFFGSQSRGVINSLGEAVILGADAVGAEGMSAGVRKFLTMLNSLHADPDNAAASIAEFAGGMSGQFVIPAVTGIAALTKAGVSPLMATLFTDSFIGFAGINPDEANLASMIPEDSEAFGFLREVLATDPDDPDYQNRLRNLVEAVTVLGLGEGAIRAMPKAVDQAKRISAKVVAGAAGGAILAPEEAEGGALSKIINRLFGSKLRDQIDGIEKGTKGQFLKGVKKDEIEANNLDAFFEGKKSVTQQEINDFLDTQGVNLDETVLGGAAREKFSVVEMPNDRFQVVNDRGETRVRGLGFTSRRAAEERASKLEQMPLGLPKFEQWQLPGGDNYREVLVTLPTNKASLAARERMSQIERELGADGLPQDRVTSLRNEFRDLAEANNPEREAGNFTGGHFDQPNVLVHVRMNDRVSVPVSGVPVSSKSINEDSIVQAFNGAKFLDGTVGPKVKVLDEVGLGENQNFVFGVEAGLEDFLKQRGYKFQLTGAADSTSSTYRTIEKPSGITDEFGDDIPLSFTVRVADHANVRNAPDINIAPGAEDLRSAFKQIDAAMVRGGADIEEIKRLGFIPEEEISFDAASMPAGDKTLFIEEIQSDWHQKGRKDGYRVDDANADVEAKLAGLDAQRQTVSAELDANRAAFDAGESVIPHPGAGNRMTAISDQQHELQTQIKHGGVPDAPFKKTWHELGLKRAIAEAAERGDDRIAWTTGAQQADRYDLSKQVRRIHLFNPVWEDGKLVRGELVVTGLDGNDIITRNVAGSDDIVELVGKEPAERLLSDDAIINTGAHVIEGQDLKIGGEGMKAFYDRMLVNAANKIGKKFGAKVENIEINAKSDINPDNITPGEAVEADALGGPEGIRKGVNTTVHSLPITPELRKAVLEKGLPLFSAGGVALTDKADPRPPDILLEPPFTETSTSNTPAENSQ